VTDRWITESEFHSIYGPQQPMTPLEARDLMVGLEVPWWVAGGWAIEAFTGVERHHEDIDLSVLRRDEAALRRHLEPRFHLWAVGDGLRHLTPETTMPPHAEQIWFREHALAPWRGEVLLNPDADGRWVSKRDPRFSAPIEHVTWSRDGVRYLRPEIVLTHKAKNSRPKDDADFEAALPLLDRAAREFLAGFLGVYAVEHPWRKRLPCSAG
jgi:hypothetical protein